MIAAVASFAGLVLRAGFALLLVIRRPRPIHPRGVVLEGEIRWVPRTREFGIAWIDGPPGQTARVTARVSRSIGLPDWLPDIIGLAVRTQSGSAPADLELASTGIGVPGRFLLRPHRFPARATLSTLLPYRGVRGPVLICARTTPSSRVSDDVAVGSAAPHSPWTLRIYAAEPTGLWHVFAEMTLQRSGLADDASLRFDAVRHPLPGTGAYEWTRRLRLPSYRLVQDRPAGAEH
ncbi:hypothetical protein [Microbacterium sp. CPCC 204701]|uniref:hypothetical protein n=1 Tax=Microbacterium sp. CPCC 204701 TaxID=2493084 RepID=UPI000FD880A0|nr:hypothetical protein [Microbacterium sp. CPCC 204701]